MRAILYDIHGNLPALEAVLADVRDAGADEFVLGGDYVMFGAFPAETIAAVRDLDATWIKGNTDRWVAGDDHDMPDAPLLQRSVALARDELSERGAQRLGSIEPTARLEDGLICHASPKNDMESFLPQPESADREADMLAGATASPIIFGHTHLQFMRRLGDRLLVNPGSVGLPFDGDPRAAYALWSGGEQIELRRVEYDAPGYVESVRERMSDALEDGVETLVRRIEQSAFVD